MTSLSESRVPGGSVGRTVELGGTITSGGNTAVIVTVELPASDISTIPINMAYSASVHGSAETDVTINNSAIESGWLDVSNITPDTLTLIIDASTDTGTITVDIDFAEDSAGATAVGYANGVQEAGLTSSKALKLSGITGWAYAHFIKIRITETATANFIFHSLLMGREI